MNFQLSDEQAMLRKMVRDFSLKEIARTATDRDEKGQFDRGNFKKIAELGLTGIPWPERYGGIGSDFIHDVIAIEQLSYACASTGFTLGAHTSFVSWPIFTYGNEQQKQRYLRRLATGNALGGFALFEKGVARDVTSMKTTAILDGDVYIMNGHKVWVVNGGVADMYIVFAQTVCNDHHQEITAFIIEAGMQGVVVGKKERTLGIRSSPLTELYFENCRIPKENRLGDEGEGVNIAMSTLARGRNTISAQAVGIAQAALDVSVDYAKERKQFGKPIAENQGISFKLADMATAIEAARLLTYQAAWLETKGLPSEKAVAMAHLFSGEMVTTVTLEAVQIFGGYGYMKDYPLERYVRDAKMTQLFDGTNDMQNMIIDSMLG